MISGTDSKYVELASTITDKGGLNLVIEGKTETDGKLYFLQVQMACWAYA